MKRFLLSCLFIPLLGLAALAHTGDGPGTILDGDPIFQSQMDQLSEEFAMFEYKAHVTDVYDADTITADIDLGFKAALKGVKLRLYSINAPEVRGAEKEQGRISRDWLKERILGKDVIVRTYKDQTGKYGRWLAEVFPVDDSSRSYNAMLVAEGLAKPAFY